MDETIPGAPADPAARAASESSAAGENPAAKRPAADKTLGEYWQELVEYLTYGLEVRGDLLRVRARNLAFRAALIGLAGVVGICFTILGCVHVARGIVNGLSAAFASVPWLGELISGVLLIAGGFGVFFLLDSHLKKNSLARTMQKYEQRKLHQRAAFGRDVRDQAAAATQRRNGVSAAATE